jgi:hypothetical protein
MIRRDLLTAALAVFIVPASSPFNRVTAAVRSRNSTKVLECIRIVLPHRESALRVGQAYLSDFPDERNICFLLEKLGLTSNRISEPMPPDLLRGLIRESTRADFDHGHTVVIERCLISKTEGRLCAAFTMIDMDLMS